MLIWFDTNGSVGPGIALWSKLVFLKATIVKRSERIALVCVMLGVYNYALYN